MSSDAPYKILGVKRDASPEEIQKAGRRLAKKLHPDLNPGNRDTEKEFKEVASAYDLLSDREKRARFDRGEIDASGAERPQQRFYRAFASEPGSQRYTTDAGFADFDIDEDILSELFGQPGPGGRSDEYVNLKVVLPEPPDSELEGFVSNWQAGKMCNPRQAMST